MRILLYILIILTGAWLGYSGRLPEKVAGKLSKLQFMSLLLLLFIMGVNIGINREIIGTFHKLGIQALLLSVFSIIFSVAGVKLVSKGLVQKAEDGKQ
ncbi:MAG: LysO family transporter [Bacillota bacterium]